MRYSSEPKLTPAHTPKAISRILLFIAFTCTLSAVLNSLFFGSPGLEGLFGLSWAVIQKSFVWQLISYIFVSESEGQGLTGSFVFWLSFNLYILWVLSSIVVEYLGERRYFLFTFLCTLLSGVAGLGGMALIGHNELLTGQMPLILGLLTLWTLFNPEALIFLFFVFPIKIKWVTIGTFALLTATSLLNLDPILFIFYLTAPVFAYFYWLFYSNTPLEAFESFKWHLKKLFFSSSINEKIIDIRTGRPKI